ncbi:MAG: FHA domain-containing protein [Polyangiaceae bacterium]|jgi:hypothetical protein
MGAIRETSSGQTRALEPQHIVGRTTPPACSQTLDQPYVSGVHAVLRWTGLGWELKDLNSRNGTYLDGRRIDPAGASELRQGARIGFGRPAEEWELVDADAPEVMAVPLDGGPPARMDGEMIALPSSEDPQATIYRTGDGEWALERSEELVIPVRNASIFDAVGRLWRFCCADLSPSTIAPSDAYPRLVSLRVATLHVHFDVSRDEEHVNLRVSADGQTLDLGSRAPNYLLLTLGRRRLADAARGLTDTTCGWSEIEELARDPSMAPPRLNIDVFRIRQMFAGIGLLDAANIVERRLRARQIRIGTGLISVAIV